MYFLADYYRFFKNTRPFITNCQRQAKALENQKNLSIFAGKTEYYYLINQKNYGIFNKRETYNRRRSRYDWF